MLGTVATVLTGYHFRGAVTDLPSGSTPIVQMGSFTADGVLEPSSVIRVDPPFDPTPYLLQAGDVLFVARGARHWARVVDDAAGMVASGHFHVIRVDCARLVPGFLAWWLDSADGRRVVESIRLGSSLQFIPRKGFEAIELPMPPLKVQERIAAVHALAIRERAIVSRLTDLREVRRESLLERIALFETPALELQPVHSASRPQKRPR